MLIPAFSDEYDMWESYIKGLKHKAKVEPRYTIPSANDIKHIVIRTMKEMRVHPELTETVLKEIPRDLRLR